MKAQRVFELLWDFENFYVLTSIIYSFLTLQCVYVVFVQIRSEGFEYQISCLQKDIGVSWTKLLLTRVYVFF